MTTPVIFAWSVVAVVAIVRQPWPPDDVPVAVLSIALGLVGGFVGNLTEGERRARAFFVLMLGAIVAPSDVLALEPLDVHPFDGRIVWGLVAVAFAWLGLRSIRPAMPLAPVDLWRHRCLTLAVIGTVPATVLGLGEPWAWVCIVGAGWSLLADGNLSIILPLLAVGYAYGAPYGALPQAGFHVLVTISAAGLLWPKEKKPDESHPRGT